MDISDITIVITGLDVVTPSSNPQYYIDIADRNNELVTTTFVQVNSLVVQINQVTAQINEVTDQIVLDKQSISQQVVVMSSYVSTAKDHKEDAEAAKNGAETALAETQQAIANADITGTSGYTMDAIDDMFRTQRNMNFVGF